MYLGDGTTIKRIDLVDKLKIDFSASPRTIEARIKEIINTEMEINNEQGQSCKLSKETKEKTVYYKLIPIEPL